MIHNFLCELNLVIQSKLLCTTFKVEDISATDNLTVLWRNKWIGYLRILPDNILLAHAFNSVKLSRFQGESFNIFCNP